MSNNAAAAAATDESSLLIDKIEVLLQSHNDNELFFVAERTLVALVLLSRVSQDDVYLHVWHAHGHWFVAFCREWITNNYNNLQQEQSRKRCQDDYKDESSRDAWVQGLQWTTLWIQRLVTALLNNNNNTTIQHAHDSKLFFETLLGSIQELLWEILVMYTPPTVALDASSFVEADVQVMECAIALHELQLLAATPLQESSKAYHDRCHAIWQRIQLYETIVQTIKPSTAAVQQSIRHHEEPSSPQSIMNETLRQLRLANNDDDQTPTEKNVTSELAQRYETSGQALCLQQGKQYATADRTGFLTGMWTLLLEYFWTGAQQAKRQITLQRKKEWALVLLELLHHAAVAANFDWNAFWPLRWASWTRLLTFSVAQVDDDNEAAVLRTLAWTTAARVIYTTTWRTILTLPGASTWITTVVRLAVGEVKIQLGWIVSSSSPENVSGDKCMLVQASCRIVVQCMDLIRELSAQDCQDAESHQSTLPAASIKSLHHSLEEALDTVVQYLNLADRRLPAIDECTIRILGCLLTEFDVFVRLSLQQKQSTSHYDLFHDGLQKDETQENITLLALTVAIEICPPTCRRDLLLGLATVLASAEGDELRVILLKESKLLDEQLFVLLKACWTEAQSADDGSAIPEASDVIEVLMDVHPVVPISDLQTVIIDWIKLVCSNDGSPVRVDLESSLACFARLQGETTTLESHAEIIRMAYRTLESSV